jgi:hypothetical protein
MYRHNPVYIVSSSRNDDIISRIHDLEKLRNQVPIRGYQTKVRAKGRATRCSRMRNAIYSEYVKSLKLQMVDKNAKVIPDLDTIQCQ